MARSMLSDGTETALARSMAAFRRMFMAGSPPPSLAAMMMAFRSLWKAAPRLASWAALRCLIFAHLECPDMTFHLIAKYL